MNNIFLIQALMLKVMHILNTASVLPKPPVNKPINLIRLQPFGSYE